MPLITYTHETRTRPASAVNGTAGQPYGAFTIFLDGIPVTRGTGDKDQALAAMSALAERYEPTLVTFANGTTVWLPKQSAQEVVGLSGEGYVVLDLGHSRIALTPCCNASGTGAGDMFDTDTGVLCRVCNQDVDFIHGDADVQVAVPVA
jgi:hypothetical protein